MCFIRNHFSRPYMPYTPTHTAIHSSIIFFLLNSVTISLRFHWAAHSFFKISLISYYFTYWERRECFFLCLLFMCLKILHFPLMSKLLWMLSQMKTSKYSWHTCRLLRTRDYEFEEISKLKSNKKKNKVLTKRISKWKYLLIAIKVSA